MLKKILNFYSPKTFFKYCLVGASGMVIDLGILYLLTEVVGFWYLAAAVISFILANLNNYFWSRSRVFKNQDQNIQRQIFLFLFIGAVGLVLNLIILYTLTEWFNIYYLLSKIIAIILVTLWNFSANKKWTFKNVMHN